MPVTLRFPTLTGRQVRGFLLALLLLSPGAALQAQEAADDEDFFDDDDFFMFDEDDGGDAIADPFEDFNRAMFAFNDKLYRGVLKPVARGLRIVPVPVRRSAGNFISNLGTPVSAISALLQGDLRNAGSEIGRFGVNTTLGLFGLFDPATGMGLVQDEEDMGQTLARYGIGSGPYLVLPFLGSSSLRDGIGLGVNALLNPVNYHLDTGEIIALRAADAEVALSLDEDTYEAFYDDALDPYVFFRSAWVQNREGRIAR